MTAEMALHMASTGPSPMAAPSLRRVLDAHPHGGGRDGRRAAVDVQVLELVDLGHRVDFIVEDGDQILVEDLLLLVGHHQEPLIGLVQFLLRERVAELLQAVAQAVAAGARRQHHAALRMPTSSGRMIS